jgi:thiamine pyrophosphokinase
LKKAVLFLEGKYERWHRAFYRRLCRGRFTVAVDGGYRFFRSAGMTPDLLIGDFDSVEEEVRHVTERTELLQFPTDKDWTDTELALDYCLEHGSREIDIVQPSLGEPDHFLANLFLLTREENRGADVRLVAPRYELRFVADSRLFLKGVKGCRVSVLPLNRSIRLTCRGTEYDVENARVTYGSTRATRNRIVRSAATLELAGKALVFIGYPRARK